MKNLKKVLAMVLAFACTFTMFASAKMYEDVQPGTEFSEAITMLSDLGIIQGKTDNKYHPEDTITRAEACALIARLMTGDPNAAGFNGAHHFKDVPAGHWASSAIGYAVVNGIAVGVDQAGTRFEPNRPIKDKEFVTMIVRALGYETPDMRNNFPFGYMSAANAIGLLQDVNMVPDTDALRGEDAQVIYNAMFVDYARGAKRVNVAHGTTVEKYPTLAEDVWHLDRAAVGTWDKHDKDDENVKLSNCKAHTWVIVGQDGDDNILAYPIEDGNTEKDSHEIYESLENKVNGVKAAAYKFKYEGTADIDTLRGYKVELWGAGKHGEPSWEKKEGKYVFSNDWKIKAIKTIAGQTKFDYDASKADSKRDDGEIKVDDETTLKLGTAADNAQKVSEKNTSKTDRTTYLSKEEYNRENVTSDKKVEAALNVRDGAQYRLMDWDGDKEIDWVVVSEASYYKVEAVSSKRLTVTSMVDVTKNKKNEEDETESLTQTWKIGDDNEIFIGKDKKNSYKVKYEVPEGLKEGDIIEVAYSTGWDKITGTVSVVEPENHKLDKVATKNHLVLTFDGEVTELAENRNEADTIVPENPSKYIDFDEEELGREFAIAKNRNGFIIHSDYATDGGNYMMVLDTDNGENKVRGELGAMKIITQDNKVLDNVEVVSDLMIDRKTSGNGYDKETRYFTEGLIVGNVYRYWKDADGRITKMESVVNGKQHTEYDYVAKNDRLTVDNKESYALKDAKVIFAVKPHSDTDDYIQHTGVDLKVDDADVLAVKQADIPDIGAKEDTHTATLDKRVTAPSNSWVTKNDIRVAFATNNNKDIKGAILGVDSFNKFNAASTKVGLVTNVAFDNNGVVSLDVATNGKTDTLSSAEKVKFEDIVSVKDYTNDKSVSVASRTETIENGIMRKSSLKDYLYKNGAYAEITTDKDGKLTGVLFMDEKNKDDGADPTLNAGNAVIGNYYQVSRKVIADVKDGSWMSVIKGSAIYTDEDEFISLDPKNVQKASDFASDANYYVIDGTPTRKDKNYNNTKASILEGFENTPDVKVGEASDVVASVIRKDNNNGDSYNVADVATKIDKDGAGDVVAVYAYKDDMEESAPRNIASVIVTDNKGNTVKTVKPGQTVNIAADVVYVVDKTPESLNAIKVYDKDHKLVATVKASTGTGSKHITATWTVPTQNVSNQYSFEAVYDSTDFAGAAIVDVDTAETKFVVSNIKFANKTGNSYAANRFDAVDADTFKVFVGGERVPVVTRAGTEGVTGLKPENFVVKVGMATKEINLNKFEELGNGFYQISLKDVDFLKADKIAKVTVALQNVALADNMQELVGYVDNHANAEGGEPSNGGQTGGTVAGAGNVAEAVFTPVDDKTPTVSEVKVTLKSADKKPVVGLKNDITATVGETVATITEGSEAGVYTLNFGSTNLRGKTVTIVVGKVTQTYDVPAAKVEVSLTPDTVELELGKGTSDTQNVTVKVNNSKKAVKIWQGDHKYDDVTETNAIDATTKVKASISDKTITVAPSEVLTTKGVAKFVVAVGDSADEQAILTVNVVGEKQNYTLSHVDAAGNTLIGNAVPAGKEIFIKVEKGGNALEAQKITVKEVPDAVVSDVAKGVVKLVNKNGWTAGETYTLVVDGAESKNTITVAAPSAKLGAKSVDLNGAQVQMEVTAIKAMSEAEVKALVPTIEGQDGKYEASIAWTSASDVKVNITPKKNTKFLMPAEYDVKLKKGDTVVGTGKLTVNKKALTATFTGAATSGTTATFTITGFSDLPTEAQNVIKGLEASALVVTGAAAQGKTVTITNNNDGTFTAAANANWAAGALSATLTIGANDYFTTENVTAAHATVA